MGLDRLSAKEDMEVSGVAFLLGYFVSQWAHLVQDREGIRI